MSSVSATAQPTVLFRGDIGPEVLADLAGREVVAWDIETTGLDWSKEHICTCQLACADGRTFFVRAERTRPQNLLDLLGNPRVRKVFHHAPFDLRFLVGRWNAAPANVVCTKVASKVLDKGGPDHSLKALLKRHLDVTIDKSERLSDWSAETLNERQLHYAVNDVRFLIPLFSRLQQQLEAAGRWPLALSCFYHLPTRATLEVEGFGDVFAY